jgi:hypothetical protein
MRTFLPLAALLVLAVAPAVADEKPLKDAVVGKWQGEIMKIKIILDIRKDGSMDYVGFKATWTLDGNNLKITTEREIPGTGTKRFQSKVEIKGDTMKLTDPDSKTMELKRVGGTPKPDNKDSD